MISSFFSKTLKSGVKIVAQFFRFKLIQVSKGILPNPRYESEKSNPSIVKLSKGIPVLSNYVSASVEQTDLCSNTRPEIPNEEIEEVQNEVVIPEESEIFPTESSSSPRKRTFHQMNKQTPNGSNEFIIISSSRRRVSFSS